MVREHRTHPEQMIAAMARYWVRQWAWHQDQAPLIEDVTMAGWIAWLAHADHLARQQIEVQNAMQDALSYWLYGVKRGRLPRRWHPGGSLGRATPVPDIAEAALRRVGLLRLWAQLAPRGIGRPSKAQQVLIMLIETEVSWNISKAVSQRYGIGARALYNGKRKIRAVARVLELGDVAEPPCSRMVARRHPRHVLPEER